ncbi:hypothetical protein DESPIGER_2407 [Desulfovibrio piger]|uniref:Uncharacterized protein n=1 Tax=Desulfovibrio piger TaxID=901 RepID=A0A1K1LHN8_9BACT|nr:hypothetical protein DESPIGER_2407 [Desulfovibrio piger]
MPDAARRVERGGRAGRPCRSRAAGSWFAAVPPSPSGGPVPRPVRDAVRGRSCPDGEGPKPPCRSR